MKRSHTDSDFSTEVDGRSVTSNLSLGTLRGQGPEALEEHEDAAIEASREGRGSLRDSYASRSRIRMRHLKSAEAAVELISSLGLIKPGDIFIRLRVDGS